MIKKIRNAMLTLAAALALAAPVAVAVGGTAYAVDVDKSVECGVELQAEAVTNGSGNCTVTDSSARVNDLIKLVINIFSLVVGVVSIIMIIVGGLRYIISGGDSGNVTSAKNTILYAIVGLVVVALAQVIVRYVLGRVRQ